MLALLNDPSKFESGMDVIKVIFFEAVLSKARKSLEHLKKIIEKYKEVFQELFFNTVDNQVEAVEIIFNVWANNLFKASSIVEKLYSFNLLSSEAIVKWAFESINTQSTYLYLNLLVQSN